VKYKSQLQALLAALAPLVIAAVSAGCASGVTTDAAPNTCGDGVQGEDEACDDGDENGDVPDACRADCTLPRCGDGVVDSGETCDDGNEENGDGCDASCDESYVCGDDACSKDLGESCSVCADDCCPCGDGECSLGEACGQCPQDCCVLCGNGELDPGEACDDGNNDDGDGCAKGCTDEDGQATCGNAIAEMGEACDDGNTAASDGCSPECQLEYVCGDGICENDVGESCVTCAGDCCPNCGDGIVNEFEECDGSVPPGFPTCQDQCYPGGSPSCTSCLVDYATCQGDLPECGNGVIECGEECDGETPDGLTCDELGYAGGSIGCTASCEVDVADCGELLYYHQEDFDEGCPAGWTIAFPWQCGVPTGGPGAAYSGTNVVSTGLAGNYTPNASPYTAHVTSPPINLSQAVNPAVSFKMWNDFGSGDGVAVLASTDGTNFTAVTQVTPAYSGGTYWGGTSTGWTDYSASLAAYAGESDVWVRIGLQSDGSTSGDAGAFVDDVLVAETCGNGVLDAGELCDGEAMSASAVCPDGTCGIPTCAADCQSFDVDACITPDCGNGVKECEEACDGNDVDGASCDSLGYDGGTLDCSASCQLDVDDCGELLSLLPLQNFETCPPAGWTLTGEWQCGVPTSGPSSAVSGTRVVATNLGGNYSEDQAWASNYVQTPAFPVNGPSPTLSFMMWLRSENSWDGLRLEVSTNGGSTWSVMTDVSPAYTDDSVDSSVAWDDVLTSWTRYRADLSAYQGQTISVRFAFFSDVSNTYPGAYIDDVVAVPAVDQLPFTIASSFPAEIGTLQSLSLPLAVEAGVDVTWSIEAQTNAPWATIDSATGVLSGMPGAGNDGAASITVRATSVDEPTNFAEKTFDFTILDAVYVEGFEACPGTVTRSPDWECGAPTSGPAAAHGGVSCIGTNGYTTDLDWGDSFATTTDIELPSGSSPLLRFWFWQEVEGSTYDGTRAEISVDGGAFTPLTTSLAYNGTVDGQACWIDDYTSWTEVTADLSAYAGQSVRIRWLLRSDYLVSYDGPFLDDIAVILQ
jgi:cysteine-rich repeat protein